MPVIITINHEDAEMALHELGVIARGLTVGRPDYDLLLADAQARQRGENIDGTLRRETVSDVTAGVETTAVTATQAAVAEEPKRRTRAKKSDAPQISTNPEDRQDPAAVEEQDKADEAAETEAAKAEQPKLTHDDVRKALKGYLDTFGMAAAQEDCPKIMGFAKASDVPDDQAKLAEAIEKLTKAAAENPFSRKPA